MIPYPLRDVMRAVSVWPFALAALLASSSVRAQSPVVDPDPAGAPPAEPVPVEPPAVLVAEPTLTPRIRLQHNAPADMIATGVMGAALISWGFLKANIGFENCTICDGPPGETNAVDGFFRDSFKQNDGAPAATISHIISYGASPVMGFALTIGVAAADNRIDEAPLNCLLVIEASLAAVIVKEGLTAFVRRERPFVHALEGEEKQKELASGDPLESFPGGHTASIMAITASSAVVSTMRGYRLAPLIWIIGSTLATTSMYLRIASDQHYFTDNVVGAIVGGVVGAAVPLIFHPRIKEQPGAVTRFLGGAMLTSNAVPGGRTVGLGWSF
jgi:membrane-associated phospholipid phosphatase